MRYLIGAAGVLLVALARAAPANLGLKFDKREGGLPTLTLPYGTWRAASYNPNGDIYTFKNIRFGAPPLGDLRWAKPAPPAVEKDVQDGSYGPICMQSTIKGPQLTGPGASSPIGQAANQFLAGIPIPAFKAQNEDCLFLDVYVPGKAIRDPSLKLPVISWFFGGAYVFGAKDQFGSVLPFYNGNGIIKQSGGNVIWVSSNYRLGAFGFLAGSTMEKDGLPNAGFYDQRAVLEWIQSYIHLLGGDKTQVSAWGESAGAGSIMNHLVAYGGTQDPLFSKAFLQSPAYEIFMVDRKGRLEDTFSNFSSLAGCDGQGLACLRAADSAKLGAANIQLDKLSPEGAFPVGPSADGNLIRQAPVLEFASGNYWKNLDSLILSHVADEADLFVAFDVTTDADFNTFVNAAFPAYAKNITDIVEAHYPPLASGHSNYSSEHDRLGGFVGESSFQCNTRFLTDAYTATSTSVYNLLYAVTPGLHATDILPLFYDISLSLPLFGADEPFPLIPGFGNFAETYQAYLASHARSGDPNKFKKPLLSFPPGITWPKVDNSGDEVGGVLRAGDLGFSTTTDDQTGKGRCGFWRDVVAATTALGGYVPPGSEVEQGLVGVKGDHSRNYKG